MKTCQRCGKATDTWILSMFNTQEICPECKEQEKKHPRYEEARNAALKAFQTIKN